jgi:glycosyltransferase involved in cell wall biosynthesis
MAGTTKSTLEYAQANEKYLNNKSFLAFQRKINVIENQYNESPLKEILENSFKSVCEKFNVFIYNSHEELNEFIKANNIDAVYTQESGEPGGFSTPHASNLYHAVFPQPMHHRHGDRYAFISKWLSDYCSKGLIKYVPYIIKTPNQSKLKEIGKEFRIKHKIPLDAKVFGRIGSYLQFNISFVLDTIVKILDKNPDIYFLFCNTKKFYDHPRILHIPAIYEDLEKYAFISAADIMIHARERGETFGLAIAEYSSCNKPIFTYANSPERAHLDILQDTGIYYNNKEELEHLFLNFKPDNKDYNVYKEFSPSNVIKIFENIFLK